jgi:hypothetical protein
MENMIQCCRLEGLGSRIYLTYTDIFTLIAFEHHYLSPLIFEWSAIVALVRRRTDGFASKFGRGVSWDTLQLERQFLRTVEIKEPPTGSHNQPFSEARNEPCQNSD